MGQMRFLTTTLGEDNEPETKLTKVTRFLFFSSQSTLLLLLSVVLFSDFWNINSANSYVWLTLMTNLVICAALIFGLVSVKNDVMNASQWYAITCIGSLCGLTGYVLVVSHIFQVTGRDPYLFAPTSPYRDEWGATDLWFESHFQAPTKFPFAFWLGASLEGSAGVPAGKVVLIITLLLMGLFAMGTVLVMWLPKIYPKRHSKIVFA